GLNVQRSIERKSAMPIVLEAVAFGPTGRKRQDWVQSIKGLDSALLIDAEARGMQRWLEIKANNVGGLFFKLRVITRHVRARAMWLQPELPPHFANGRLTDSDFFGQSVTAPMRRAIAGTASCQFQDPRLGRRTAAPVLVPTVARSQTHQTLLRKALLPNANVSISATQSPTNLTI